MLKFISDAGIRLKEIYDGYCTTLVDFDDRETILNTTAEKL